MNPFIKWAGGKKQLLPTLTQKIPKHFNTYYEPFIGGGALLFNLLPDKAVINDINKPLIHLYRCIKEDLNDFLYELNAIDKDFIYNNNFKMNYYDLRNRYNSKIAYDIYDVETAALLLFLNKHCFNGLYRVNSRGLFNVPFNNYEGRTVINEEIYLISNYLYNVQINEGDFEVSCNIASNGDFVFFDSPYDDSFTSYSKEGFREEDHIRLSNLFKELTNKGCYCMLTNHDTDLIKSLYKNDFKYEIVNVKRMINSDGSNRIGKEVIITNY